MKDVVNFVMTWNPPKFLHLSIQAAGYLHLLQNHFHEIAMLKSAF